MAKKAEKAPLSVKGIMWSIPHEIDVINWEIEQNEGEITEEIQSKIDEIMDRLNPDRISSLCKWIQNLEGLASFDRTQAQFFSGRAKSRENLASKIRKLILNAMVATEIPVIQGHTLGVKVMKSPKPSMAWEGEGDIPATYVIVETRENKDAMYQDWKAQKAPAGIVAKFGKYLKIF